jgi:putative flippase GtrA
MASTTRADRRRALADLRRQGTRFVLTGGIVAAVYVGTTTVLSQVIGLGFELSLAIGFLVAIATHFILQRLFVWRHSSASYALPLHHQLGRYLSVAALQYGVTAGITAALPRALGVSPEPVYLLTVAVISAANFLVFPYRIFHPVVDPLG